MNYTTAAVAFLAMVFGIVLGLMGELDAIWMVFSVLAIPLAAAFGFHLFLEKKFYTGLLFSSHFVMYLFTAYVFINRDRILEVPQMDFSVFTVANLQTALLALAVSVAVIAAISLVFGKRSLSIRKLGASSFFSLVFGKIALLGTGSIRCFLLLSLLGAIGSFHINTTVLEVPYPYNGIGRRVPGFVLVLPTALGLISLAAIHSKLLLRVCEKRALGGLLTLARINFIILPVLCLMVVGQRGFTTFMWIIAAGLELVSSRKTRTTVLYGLLFLFLAYCAYSAWPFLRWNLASMETSEALVTGLEYVLQMKPNEPVSELIDLDTYPMIGQSLFHLLYVIELENSGNSLAGSTFLNLIPQALPEFLDGVLWDRPLNDNFKIPYVSSGGFLAIANAYWNGGMLVMAIFVASVSALFLYFDHHLLKEWTTFLYRLLYFLYIPLVVA
jgi:nitrate reductase NapE component